MPDVQPTPLLHGPLERRSERVAVVVGSLPGMPPGRVMTVVRRRRR